jgi:hypothetical protein
MGAYFGVSEAPTVRKDAKVGRELYSPSGSALTKTVAVEESLRANSLSSILLIL